MNSLSWMIYLAYFLPVIKTFMIFVFVISFIFVIIVYLEKENIRNAKKPLWTTFSIAATALFFSVIIPERNTILMIAVSETGESVIKSEEAQTLFKLVQKEISESE